jgi:two-component system, response regulator / RNA-binding antiterminator
VQCNRYARIKNRSERRERAVSTVARGDLLSRDGACQVQTRTNFVHTEHGYQASHYRFPELGPATSRSRHHIHIDRQLAWPLQLCFAMPEDKTNTGTGLHVLIVHQNVTRASVLEGGLRAAGILRVTLLRDTQNLVRRIVEIDPEVIFIDLGNPDRDVLEQMLQVARSVSRPIAMFVDQSDSDTIDAAVEAGVGAFVVDGLKKERVKAVLDTAVSRFKVFNNLRDELDKARTALDERKVVERAKGILMKERELSEEAAYSLLRKAAMNENRRISEVAQSVVTAFRLIK